jgi:hypothetical protein
LGKSRRFVGEFFQPGKLKDREDIVLINSRDRQSIAAQAEVLYGQVLCEKGRNV